ASGYTSGVSFTNSSYQATNNRAYINAYTTGQPVTCPVGNQYFTSYLIPPPVITITGLVKNSYCNNEPNFTLQGSAQYNYVVSSLGVVSSGTASVTTFGPVPPNPPDPALVGAVFQPFSASTGNHPIRYSYTDPNGCSNFHDTTIIINASPVAGFEIDSGYCATKLTYFKDTSTVPPGTTLSYSWNFGDGTTLADTSHLQNPTYKYLVAGGFPVSLIVQTNQGCSNSTILPNNKLLIIQTIPTSNFSYKYQCLGDLTVFDTLSIVELGAFKSRTWIFSNALNIPFDTLYQTSSVSTGYTFPGSGDYKVTVVDSTTLGCTNRLKKPLFILPYITPTSSSPYAVSFQNTSGGWGQDGTKSSWVHSVPLPAKKPNMYYGGKGITDSVWVTSADTSYNIGEKSSLNSPCFNFNQLNKPMISLKLWTVTQAQIAGAVLNVSVDDGITWNTLGKQGDGVNWYNNIGIAGSPGTLSTNDGWSGIDTSWQQAKLGLSAYANYDPTKKVRFRVTFGAPSDSTIARSEGIALDSVWVGNRNKVVMMEHFTNNTANGSTTPAIAVANDTINTIRDTRSNDVAAVYYHTSFPAQDPFNAFYPQGPSSRVLYYGISSAPWTILDGNFYNGNIYSGGTPTSKIGVNDIDARSLETAIFNLSMTTSFNPGVATVAAKVTYTGSTSFAKDVVLNTVITQDDSSGVVKYGSIVRQMLPDAGGSYISKTWNTNDSLIQVNSWNHNLPSTAKLGAVIFVQDPSTREIYQAAYFRGTGSYGSPVITGVQGESSQGFKVNMFPNPATDEVFFIYGKAIRENATWEVYDNTGRKVAEGVCSAGREGFSINTSNFSGGVYHVKLSGDNGAMDTKELIVIH
ncbi:MAG TPA: PKD domain-containing protein, partial [Cytophagaceae bacterium]|nr:PKD domain-containing protein [Cytophagaceae bacterium]